MGNVTTIKTSIAIGRDLTAQGDDGAQVRIASFRGSVQPQRSVTITVDLAIGGAEAAEYADDIRRLTDDFITEMRALAVAQGVPV